MREVILCADEESLRDPSLIGLEGERLDGQAWLHAVPDAGEARAFVREQPEGEVDEAWVASSNDVDPINLAAALKRERQQLKVCLVAWRGSGSLLSRASAAGIDEVIGYPELARRYAALKGAARAANPRRRGGMAAGPAGESAIGLGSAVGEGAGSAPGMGRGGACGPEDDPVPARPSDGAAGDAPDASAAPAGAGAAPSGGRADAGAGANFAAPAHAARRGYALCVASASGGTGKSTVAALSALIAASHGYRTAIIDADLQFGDIAAMFPDRPSVRVDAAIAQPSLVDETPLPDAGPLVLSAPERIEQSELYLSQVPGLIDRVRESFDVVVVNTGAFWTEGHIQMMETCSNTLFLMDQRPTSVQAVKRALDLCARCGVASHPFLFAVNRCSRKGLLTSLDISCALGGVPVAELKEGGAAVSELLSSGMAGRLVDDRNDLCLSLNDFLGGVIPAALGGVVPEPGIVPKKAHGKAKQKHKGAKRRGKVA